MKITTTDRPTVKRTAALQPEYRFDYTNAKPNRFAKLTQPGSLAVVLDPNVAEVFKDAESVNAVLRALLTTMPAQRVTARRTARQS